MTTTPGATPGSSDSSEPDGGDNPTTPAPSTSATPAAAATAPRIPEPSAPLDSAPADKDQPAPEPQAPRPAGQPAGQSEPAGEPERAAEPAPTDEPEPAAERSGTRQDDGQKEKAAVSPPGWAQHQPPPATESWARWTPPAGSQPPPPKQGGPRWGPTVNGTAAGPAGQSSPGGWHHPQMAWGMRAPDPKPGVIPLRPLGAGDILGGAMTTMRLHWRKIIGYTLAVGAVTEAVSAVLQHRFSNTDRLNDLENNPDASASDIAHALGGSMVASGLTLLVTMFGSVIATALIATVVSRAVLGRQITAAELRGDLRARLPQLLGLAVLMPLITCLTVGVTTLPGIIVALLGAKDVGAVLAVLGGFVGVIAMLWVFVQLSLTPSALMLEKQGVAASVKRSWKLVSGSWWRVLGVQLLAVLVVTITTAMIGLPFMLIGDAVSGDSGGLLSGSATNWTYLAFVAVGGTIGTAITLPITAGCTTLLYLDQRIRRESLDIELIRASRDG